MKTPKQYEKMIKDGYIEKDILGEVIYSINKRAKNWRDKKREYRGFYNDKYDNYFRAEEKEQHYYKMKDEILAKLDIKLIHKQNINDRELYFKFYEVGSFSFHSPVDFYVLPKDLEVVKLTDFTTFGRDILELLSVPFCNKVHQLLLENKLEIR